MEMLLEAILLHAVLDYAGENEACTGWRDMLQSVRLGVDWIIGAGQNPEWSSVAFQRHVASRLERGGGTRDGLTGCRLDNFASTVRSPPQWSLKPFTEQPTWEEESPRPCL